MQGLKEEIIKNPPNISMCNLTVDYVVDKLCDLERNVNKAVLKLCINVFSAEDDQLALIVSNGAQTNENETDFDLYFDRLFQICMFSLSCSSECKFLPHQ